MLSKLRRYEEVRRTFEKSGCPFGYWLVKAVAFRLTAHKDEGKLQDFKAGDAVPVTKIYGRGKFPGQWAKMVEERRFGIDWSEANS